MRPPSVGALVRDLDRPERAEAAARALLAREDARGAWAEVLDRWLDGALAQPLDRASLASVLDTWPSAPERAERAVELLPYLPAHRRRTFVPEWALAWERGERWASEALASAPMIELARFTSSSPRFAGVIPLGQGDERERRRLLPWLEARFPEVAASMRERQIDEPPPPPEEPTTLEGWLAEATEHRGRRATRAVGRIARVGAVEPLITLAAHRDATVRHAVLRHLRRLAPRERYLDIALSMLARERQPELRRRLVAVLGHAHHTPALALLTELVHDRDPRVRRTVREVLVAMGPLARSALLRARSEARPDRREAYEELLGALDT